MNISHPLRDRRVIVIGAGVAGLTAAARLAHAGFDVLVFDQASAPGGKMRCVQSAAGPVDAGPTVLTMRSVFDQIFAECGARLEEHVTLLRQPVIARHFWPDGSQLDLHDTAEANAAAITAFAGARAAREFRRFDRRARQLFDAFDAPMMRAPAPSFRSLAAHVAGRPWLLPKLAPFTSLHGLLARSFSDPRLVQLFGRYATYVGGSPYHAPALLALIWRAESAGVWAVKGGMHRLARALEDLGRAHGARYHYDMPVKRITTSDGVVTGITLGDGTPVSADAIVFNGDPRALARGLMGRASDHIGRQTLRSARSLSAEVWAFAAEVTGPELSYHNVFFRTDPEPEFRALMQGKYIDDPTVYVCAMDRNGAAPRPALERFETIANAPPLPADGREEEAPSCPTRSFQTLARFGLRFSPTPDPTALTTPRGFAGLHPASAGSLYGQSPHGMTAALNRPQARTALGGLFLAGGGTHPGAGVPMAALSGQHAAAAIMQSPISTSRSPPTAMPGGMSTG
ncbi:phytoene desaturase [Roseovarius faecimaris]|uniref:Phytoene desaturase n=1 Tax=Roseovarius faecimaris TaxID=2494550 RepID=A0A6I6IQH9_9RHOB|nr:1-hydroxycarotenoid 3,4-desaturase CrtD [Roseovarius faecimaris]QGX97747.1 phytoene desaturase [Roseovarius faecimaris]